MRTHATFLIVVSFCLLPLGANLGGEKKKPDPNSVPLPAVLERKPKEAKGDDDELRKLMIARYNVALLGAQKYFGHGVRFGGFRAGAGDQIVKRLFEAEFAIALDAPGRVKACEDYLVLAKVLEHGVQEAIDVGARVGARFDNPANLEVCRFLVADAEVRLLQAKRAGRWSREDGPPRQRLPRKG
jgi:hypothetical protein